MSGVGQKVAQRQTALGRGHLGADAEHVVEQRRREHVSGRAVGDQAAPGQHGDAVGEACGQAEVVQGGDDRPALSALPTDAREQVELVSDVEVGRRLVEQQHRRVLGERLCEQCPLLLAAGQRRHLAAGEVSEAHRVERAVDDVAVGLTGLGEPAEVRRAAERDDLADRERGRQVGRLPHERQALPTLARRPVADGAPEQSGFAVGWQQAGEGAQQRRLAGAVGADERDDLARPDPEVHRVQDPGAAQRHAQTVRAEGGGRRDRVSGHKRRGRGVGAGPHALAMLRTVLFVLLVSATGCDSGLGEAQRQFDAEALLGRPEGFTEIEIVDGTARVVREDLDDWRLGPAFLVNTQVTQRPVPNPVGPRQEFTLTLFTDGLPGGILLRRLDARGDAVVIPGTRRPEASQRGFYAFTLDGDDVAGGIDGLYRVVVEDGRGRIVTYGDVLVVD